MSAWLPYAQVFLDKTIRHAEFGNSTAKPHCATCQQVWQGKADGGEGEVVVHKLYCCHMCGEFFECGDCCCQRHKCIPLHRVEVSTLERLYVLLWY